MAKKKKVRVEMRKNRSKPPRQRGWTRGFHDHGYTDEATVGDERIRAKGELSRKRTIIQEETGPRQASGEAVEMPSVDVATCLPGRVLRVHGLQSVVETDDGRLFRCAVRRLLRTLATDERSVVTTGDRVWIRPAPGDEGFIERVEPRHGLLTRSSRGREHVLVANVDQAVIVVSLVEPDLKPHLLDRYLVTAEQGGLKPIVCLNKADLVDPVPFQPLIGLYSQLGILVALTSATTGLGIDWLRQRLRGRQTVFSGQSGVGKSSLLNAIQPGLGLRVREVSETTQKGKHTTTTAELLRLDLGEGAGQERPAHSEQECPAHSDRECRAYVVDTPGVRQLQPWGIRPEEVEGFFPELRPFVALCGYPDCTHTHEDRCAVKRAVQRRQISEHRYLSYLGIYEGKME